MEVVTNRDCSDLFIEVAFLDSKNQILKKASATPGGNIYSGRKVLVEFYDKPPLAQKVGVTRAICY